MTAGNGVEMDRFNSKTHDEACLDCGEDHSTDRLKYTAKGDGDRIGVNWRHEGPLAYCMRSLLATQERVINVFTWYSGFNSDNSRQLPPVADLRAVEMPLMSSSCSWRIATSSCRVFATRRTQSRVALGPHIPQFIGRSVGV